MNNESTLAGKVAVVTGATAFIGRAIALKLGSLGATVIVNGRNEVAGKEVVAEIEAAGGKAFFEKADITKADEMVAMMDRIVAQHGHIDNLAVSGAGASNDSLAFKFFKEMSVEDIDTYISSHWLTRIYAVKAAYPHMVKSGGGKIVMIGTDAGRVATVGESMIGGSTGGMMQMTRSLAREFGRDKVRINTVAMSFIWDAIPRWGKGEDALESTSENGGMIQNLKRRMLFEVRTTDIAEAVAFFSTPASDAITGQTLSVNGGLTTPG